MRFQSVGRLTSIVAFPAALFPKPPSLALAFVSQRSNLHRFCTTTTYHPELPGMMGEDTPRSPKRRKIEEVTIDEESQGEGNGKAGDTPSGEVRKSGKKKTMSRSEYRRKGKGRRRGTRDEEAEASTSLSGEPKAPRLPKRQCALLIGFCGAGYNGMQM